MINCETGQKLVLTNATLDIKINPRLKSSKGEIYSCKESSMVSMWGWVEGGGMTTRLNYFAAFLYRLGSVQVLWKHARGVGSRTRSDYNAYDKSMASRSVKYHLQAICTVNMI